LIAPEILGSLVKNGWGDSRFDGFEVISDQEGLANV